MRKRFLELIVPAAAAAIFALLNFVPAFQTAEQRVYDLFLHLKPPIPERGEILLLDVDDTAIENVGLWPWSRDYMARGLVLLRELDSGYVTFDIEYVDESPQAVDGRYLRETLPAVIDSDFGYVEQQIRALFGALTAGQIPLSDAEDFVDQLAGLTQEIRDDLKSAAAGVVQDNDALLGQAARFHGETFFTINILSDDSASTVDHTSAIDYVELTDIQVAENASLRRGEDVNPAIDRVLLGAAGAGFPNVVVDPDGVRRRIDLLATVDDHFFGQLVMRPLLDWLGNPAVTAERDRVVLTDAMIPGSDEPTTIDIPLATDGRMLINWPKAEYEDSFRHETYWRLVSDWTNEEAMVQRLEAMYQQNFLFAYPDADQLFAVYDYTQQLEQDMLNGGDRSQIQEWRELRAMFFEMIGALLISDAEEQLLGAIESQLQTTEDPQLLSDLRFARDEANRLYSELGEIYQVFTANRAVLMEEIPGSFIIIGHVGTSTTDIGVTPFDEEYMNVGTHASLVNTVLQQQFLDDLPWTVSLAVMLVMAALVTLLISNQPPTPSLLIGFGAIVLIAGGGVVLFLTTGVFLNMLTPLVGVFLTFVILTAIKFVRENRQKNEIRQAFGTYMSPAVVAQVTEDPSKLALGGVKKNLTAMFTDIRGFSTISESLSPEALTDLLNRYLGAMCDIILDEGGTIDKFEGDAIIAFWGAPIDMDDAAERACRAAIAMKKREGELNEEWLRDRRAPSPLLTRIGINSGDMTVGNMGTKNRMDYTAMGHNMNLAARLEGVNKQYGTWVLASEQTYNEFTDLDSGQHPFSLRRLDRVRVVGISEPVRLFELIDLYAEVDKDHDLIEKLKTFNAGLTAFEEKDWKTASDHFNELLAKYPEDGPTKLYAKRCKAFLKKPPAPDWDGVFNLTKK
jgi:adenylate cyclase